MFGVGIMRAMAIFYWVLCVLIVGTFVPSAFLMLVYGITGNDAALSRARGLWAYTRMFALAGFNILVWGHVLVGLWHIWRH